MSLICISSKQSSVAESATASATSRTGSVDALRPRPGDTRVHFLHEGMEMHPPLRLDRGGLEEEIHQHRLAASDPAVEVEPRDKLLLQPVAPPAEKPGPDPLRRRGVVVREPHRQELQLLHRQPLRRVGGERAVRHLAPVERHRAFAHPGLPVSRRNAARRAGSPGPSSRSCRCGAARSRRSSARGYRRKAAGRSCPRASPIRISRTRPWPLGGLTFMVLTISGWAASSASVIHSAVTGSPAAT